MNTNILCKNTKGVCTILQIGTNEELNNILDILDLDKKDIKIISIDTDEFNELSNNWKKLNNKLCEYFNYDDKSNTEEDEDIDTDDVSINNKIDNYNDADKESLLIDNDLMQY